MKKIFLISGVISLLLLQGTFQLFALSGSDISMYEDLQQKVVTGKIVDSDGNPMPGVNIIEKSTTNGSISDANGGFSINVASNSSVLAFSFIGFVTQEITVGT